jgi:hypothetical protein
VVGLFFSLARDRRFFSAGGSGILISGVRLDVDITSFAERNCAIEANEPHNGFRLGRLRGQAQSEGLVNSQS